MSLICILVTVFCWNLVIITWLPLSILLLGGPSEEKFSFIRGNKRLFTSPEGVHYNDTLVLGAAGSGKTTAFTRRLPYGWATDELFQEVELLFIVTVRDSKEASLESLLGLRSIGLKAEERKSIDDFLETNNDPRKILIVVDGKSHVWHMHFDLTWPSFQSLLRLHNYNRPFAE